MRTGRIGWTEGQRYTVAIGLVFAGLLLGFGLPSSLRSATPSAAAEERAPALSPSSSPSVPPSVTVVASTLPPPPRVGPIGTVTTAAPRSSASSTPPRPESNPPSVPLGDPSDPPEDPACPATAAAQPLVVALAAIDIVPDQSTTLLLALLTGCSEADPVVLLLGALAEVGSGLPDLGIEIPGLPIPFLEIPLSIVEAVQPLREAIDPVCDAVGSVIQIFSYAFGTWPSGAGAALGTPLRQVALVCGQLRIT